MCFGGGSPPHATRALGRGSCGVPSGRHPRPTGEITRGRGRYLLDGRVGSCWTLLARRSSAVYSSLFRPIPAVDRVLFVSRWRMRILHVVPSYLPAVRYVRPIFAVHGLCRALAARGHELQAFTTNIDGPGITPTAIGTPVDLDGIQIRYFPCPLVRRLYWRRLSDGRFITRSANSTSCIFILLFCGRRERPRARRETLAFLTCYRREGC
jgi:hypothetical protein